MQTGEVTVVDDVVVGEHHPFGKTPCPGVYCMLTTSSQRKRLAVDGAHRPARFPQQQHLGGVVHAAVLLLSDVDHILQCREMFRSQLAALRVLSSGNSS